MFYVTCLFCVISSGKLWSSWVHVEPDRPEPTQKTCSFRTSGQFLHLLLKVNELQVWTVEVKELVDLWRSTLGTCRFVDFPGHVTIRGLWISNTVKCPQCLWRSKIPVECWMVYLLQAKWELQVSVMCLCDQQVEVFNHTLFGLCWDRLRKQQMFNQ